MPRKTNRTVTRVVTVTYKGSETYVRFMSLIERGLLVNSRMEDGTATVTELVAPEYPQPRKKATGTKKSSTTIKDVEGAVRQWRIAE